MCNCNNTPLCSNNDCSCPVKDLSTDCVLYTGADLLCSGIKSQTILTDLIIQLDTFICSLETQPTLNIINIGTGVGVYKGIVGSNRQLRSIKSPDNSVGVAVSSNGNEIHLTANSADLIDKISLSFDWKNNLITTTKTPEDLPVGITDSVYKRTGYIGYHKPILAGTVVEHPNVQHIGGTDLFAPILIEAQVYNLGVNIKNFDKIADLNPVLVISKYTHTKKRENKEPEPIPGSTTGELFPETTFRKGSFKFSADNDPVRLTRVPIQAQYQVIDFGQEHYFATNETFQNEGILLEFGNEKRLVKTRGNGFSYTSLTTLAPGSGRTVQYSKAFVYLQFHIEIDVAGEKILSKPLGRLKMILSVPLRVEEVDPTIYIPSNIVAYNHLGDDTDKNPVTTIRYKHS